MPRPWKGAREALEWFEQTHPTDDEEALRSADAWRTRALPNMMGYLQSRDEDLEEYRKGDPDYIEGIAHNIMTLSRNLDHVGEKWWDYVPLDIGRKYGLNMNEAQQMAANIYRTLGGVRQGRAPSSTWRHAW